jgi:hypothetical protein
MPDADDALLAAVDLARSALTEITPAETIGEPVGHVVEDDHVLSLLFESKLPGYLGWRWTVTLSRLDEESEPSVLETELMPGDRSLLAPEWIPWSERMAEYRAAQEAAALAAESDDDEEDGDDDEVDEFDADDLGDDDLDDVDLGEEDLDEDGDGPAGNGDPSGVPAPAQLHDDEADQTR